MAYMRWKDLEREQGRELDYKIGKAKAIIAEALVTTRHCPASGTSSGDLACLVCAMQFEREEEAQAMLDELEFGSMWENYPGELIAGNLDFQG